MSFDHHLIVYLKLHTLILRFFFRSSRRDSLNDRPPDRPPQNMIVNTPQNVLVNPPQTMIVNSPPLQHVLEPHLNMDNSYSGELVKEFQKTRQKLQEALALRDREREEMQKQLYGGDNIKYLEEW